METIRINHPNYDKPIMVNRADYIKRKTKDLKEFGYTKLTEEEVEKQLDNVLRGEPLNVIGMFIKSDIALQP